MERLRFLQWHLNKNGLWFLQEGNTQRELVSGADCDVHGDLICDTPGSPGYVPLSTDPDSSWYFNTINRECIYHGYGGHYNHESEILKIGGYNLSFDHSDLLDYNYCDLWGFEDYYGLNNNCDVFTNYDNMGDFFGTKNLPEEECLNEDKSEYASECHIDNYIYLPLGNNFMQAGTTTLNYCSPRPIGHDDYNSSNHGFTEEQFANIRYSIENDYLGCIDSGSVNYNTNALIDRGDCDCFNHLLLDECGICGGQGAIYECGCYDKDENVCDCEGNTLDCAGDCGGSAVEDECSVCNGNGPDAGYDCNGDCIDGMDCAGECDGSAVEDECGVCNGDGPDAGYDCNGNQLSLLNDIVPKYCSINSIYPNPFNPITAIDYGLTQNSDVQISIYDINGRLITTLINEFQIAGYHSITWDGSSYSSGIYFLIMSVENFTATRKLVLIK